jgi:proteasome lid subunit RPN8/RPN11
MSTVALSDRLRLAIIQHALAEQPREACGLVVRPKRGGRFEYVPCQNLQPLTGQFILAPRDFAAAEQRGTVLALVHSHPYGTTAPSEADRMACEASNLPWAILALPSCEIGWIEPSGYVAPLEGRAYCWGVSDCWSIVVDWYARERAIALWNPAREPDWWNRGENMFLDLLPVAGFERVSRASEPGDVMVMQLGGAPVPMHAALYLGSGQMLHQMVAQPSEVRPYAGYWEKHTHSVWRYSKEAADAA